MNTMLGDAGKILRLAERLARCPEVRRFDEGNWKEASTLAHALADLEGAFQRFLNEMLPRLANENISTPEMHEVLLDIGEEFRHILYHIGDPRFYRYLLQHDKDR